MEPQFPPTDEARMHKGRLQLVGLVHLAFIIATLFANAGGFMELIIVMFLFCGAMSFNYCCLLFYIVYTLINLFQAVEPIGLYM